MALNHDPVALAVHKANHPGSVHYCQDIFSIEPNHVTMGRPRVILENVEDFTTWGPLDARCAIVKAREGETFRLWLR